MAADQNGDDSAFDFLYVDLPRIGSLLSQFGTDGVLTELVRDAKTGSGGTHTFDAKIYKYEAAGDEGSGLTRRFDPQWLIPMIFLDRVLQRLKKKIVDTALGEFVHLIGQLWLLDTGLLQSLYKPDGTLRAMAMTSGMERAQTAGEDFNYDRAELELDMLISAPRQVQFRLSTSEGVVWSTIRPDGLVTPAEELAVKHGIVLDGDWHVVGIKDANQRPHVTPNENDQVLTKQVADQPHMIDVIHLAEGMRRMFGRPSEAFGITPLMIFRPIGAP